MWNDLRILCIFFTLFLGVQTIQGDKDNYDIRKPMICKKLKSLGICALLNNIKTVEYR